MTDKKYHYEIRRLPEDIGIFGEVVCPARSQKDAERLLEVMKFQGKDVENMFICKQEIPQRDTGEA